MCVYCNNVKIYNKLLFYTNISLNIKVVSIFITIWQYTIRQLQIYK